MPRKTNVFASQYQLSHIGRTLVRFDETDYPWAYIRSVIAQYPQDLRKIMAKLSDVYRKQIQQAMRAGNAGRTDLAPLHPVTISLRHGNNPGGNLKKLVKSKRITHDKYVVGVHDPATMPLMERYQTRHVARMQPYMLGWLRDREGSDFVDKYYPRDRSLLREVVARPIIADVANDPEVGKLAARAVFARINGLIKGAENVARARLAERGASKEQIDRIIQTISTANNQR